MTRQALDHSPVATPPGGDRSVVREELVRSESPVSRPLDRQTGQATDSRFSQLFSKWGQCGEWSVVGRVTFAASYVCRTDRTVLCWSSRMLKPTGRPIR